MTKDFDGSTDYLIMGLEAEAETEATYGVRSTDIILIIRHSKRQDTLESYVPTEVFFYFPSVPDLLNTLSTAKRSWWPLYSF